MNESGIRVHAGNWTQVDEHVDDLGLGTYYCVCEQITIKLS